MRRTRRALVVVAAVAALAVLPLGGVTANASPAAAHPTAMGSIPLEVIGCC
jgi:hypothetical protein